MTPPHPSPGAPFDPFCAKLTEVTRALERLAGGDPTVQLDVPAGDGHLAKLCQAVNATAGGVAELVDTAHEFAMGLAEHFDVLHRVVAGDLTARIQGESSEEILRYLQGVTNQTIETLASELLAKRKAEKRLQQSEARYRTLFEKSGDATLLMDSEHFLDCNEACLALFGYTDKATFLAQSPATLSPASQPDGGLSRDLAPVMVRKALASGSCRFEWLHQRQDNTPFHAEVTFTAIPMGQKQLLHVVLRDVTAQRTAEEEHRRLQTLLQHTQKMEAIGTLAGGIAHDFNNALGPIMGYTEMAMDELDEGSLVRRNLGHVLVSAERARDLVQQILAFSRDGGTKVAPLNAAPVVAETVQLLRATLPTTVEIRSRVEKGEAWVNANPSHIHQVVMNLCTNAGYAIEAVGGGLLKVELVPVTLAPEAARQHPGLHAGDYLSLTVCDTGAGIPEAIRGRIFEPFFTTKGVGEGSGMGLAMVHGVVTELGGAVRVESAIGTGTRFEVLLPRIPPPASQTEPSLPAAREPAAGRVLLVDDEQIVVDFMGQALERLGYQVTALTSSEDAWALFDHDPSSFDVVITDQTMPRLTGTALAERMLARRPGLPIVLCTGFSRSVTPEVAAAKGIRTYLSKPFSIAEIGAALKEALES